MKNKKLFTKAISLILCIVMMTSIIPAGIVGAVAESDSDTLLEVGRIAYAAWGSGTYNEYTVETNGTDGDIVIVFTPERNNWDSSGNNLLSVNGVKVISTGGGGNYNLGSTNIAANFNARVITVTIKVATGEATIVDAKENSGTANVGAIGDTFTLKINQEQNNGWELSSLVVTQIKGESGDASDTGNTGALYTNDFDSDADVASGTRGDTVNVKFNADVSALQLSHNNWDYSKAYWETSVNLNGTDGLITLKTTMNADASQEADKPARGTGAILTVNGKVIVQNGTGSHVVILGGKEEIKGCWNAHKEVITLVINPQNGIATLTFEQDEANAENGSFPKLTVVEGIELGAIGESLSIRYGTNRHADFYVYSLNVTQASGNESEPHVCEYTTTINNATCTTPEFTLKKCSVCGDSDETVSAPVLGHTWSAWSKADGVSTRSCTVCGKSEGKTISAIDTTKTLLAIGDSLAYGLNLSDTVNGSWAKKVADSLGMSSYSNIAVSGSETYRWYSTLTGKAAPNNNIYTAVADGSSVDKSALTSAIADAGVVAVSLGSNDMIGGYVGFRSAEQVHNALKGIVDEIHTINPDAVIILVGYAYGVSMVAGGEYEDSYQLFIDFNALMTETFNSEAYNSFVYYVDVSDTMSDATLLGTDKVHPTADGHRKIADRVISALGSISVGADTITWEEVSSYVNHFDGKAPQKSVLADGPTGENGVLTVAPSTDKNGNCINVGSANFPGKTVVTFKFNIPELPESGSINIFHDRAIWQSYVCVFSKVNEETGATEFFASVGNKNEGNSVVKVEKNTWYDVTILFAENASAYSRVYIGNTFIGTVEGKIIGQTAGWGFANFAGCSGAGETNAATYQIDDFIASTRVDDALVNAYGIQKSEPMGMLYDVRFILSVDDIYTAESAIGLDITVNYNNQTDTKTGVETDLVFESIFASYGTEIVTASDLGGKYIAAIVVKEIPVNYECVEFVVSPYAVVDGVKYYARTMTATVYSAK